MERLEQCIDSEIISESEIQVCKILRTEHYSKVVSSVYPEVAVPYLARLQPYEHARHSQ